MTMMVLGPFRFALTTAAYQKVWRNASFRWQEQDRIGRKPAAQFTGGGLQTLDLEGVVYPHFRGGAGQFELMRRLAGMGEPLPLVSGRGQIMGRWTILAVDETNTVFFQDGSAKKIEFKLTLREYGEDGIWQNVFT